MSADDSLLFIDANKYLDLYRTDSGKKLLAPLEEQSEYIFITQQVVAEVQRNKILVAAEFLGRKSREFKIQTLGVPDHLSGTSAGLDDELRQKMREISQKVREINKDVDTHTLGIMEQINCSKDEVSKVLIPIFTKAVAHSPEELQKARDRKEVGNPPGKSTNALGDQLTWEQILTHFKGKKRLWLISRDSDYGTIYGGKGFLNGFLYEELCKIASEPAVYLFQDLVEGIEHFLDTTGVKAENRLTPEEVIEIEKEEKSLPHLPQEEDAEIRSMAALMNAIGAATKKPNFMLDDSVLNTIGASIAAYSATKESLNTIGASIAAYSATKESTKSSHILNAIGASIADTAGTAQMASVLHGIFPPPHQLQKGIQEKKKKPPANSLPPTQRNEAKENNDEEESG